MRIARRSLLGCVGVHALVVGCAPAAPARPASPEGAPPAVAPAPPAPTTPAGARAPAPNPGVGEAIRLRGDAELVEKDGVWRSGTARLSDVLPVGYAPPTPPGAIDVKRYPVVRRALVSGDSSARAARGDGFWPLFRHINSRDIPMTVPVEMDYGGLGTPEGDREAGAKTDAAAEDGWTMAFLYRTPEQGPVGPDPRIDGVTVVDEPERLVIALGFQGSYEMDTVEARYEELLDWLAADGRWRVTGPARVLHYNGPERRSSRRWGEVQVPVTPRRAGPASQDASAATTPTPTP